MHGTNLNRVAFCAVELSMDAVLPAALHGLPRSAISEVLPQAGNVGIDHRWF